MALDGPSKKSKALMLGHMSCHANEVDLKSGFATAFGDQRLLRWTKPGKVCFL